MRPATMRRAIRARPPAYRICWPFDRHWSSDAGGPGLAAELHPKARRVYGAPHSQSQGRRVQPVCRLGHAARNCWQSPTAPPPRLILSRGWGGQDGPLFIDPGPRWPEISIVLDKPSMRRAQGLASPARAATLKNDKPGIAIEGPQGRRSDRARPRMLGAVSTRRLFFVNHPSFFLPFNLGEGGVSF